MKSAFAALALILVAFIPTVTSAEPTYHTVPAELVKPRDGLGNVQKKLESGETVRVAYLGGSITAANGWRVKTTTWLKEKYPTATIEEIHAAIGGTGSDLGVFRLERDALQYKPDLLFVEFAVNDGGASPDRIWKAMEGIVRQTWAANPKTDICFVYTFRVNYEEPLRKGECPQAASAMELLADHYGIPSVNFAKKIVELESDGKLTFQSDEPEEDKIQFSKDGVHPLDAGHELYTEVLADAIQQMATDAHPADHQAKLKTSFVEDHWQAAKMVPIQPDMLSGNWKALPEEAQLQKSFGKRMGQIYEATEPGSKLTFRFKGSSAKLYDLLGPDGGQVIISVDGKLREKPVPRFDSYCTYHRIATLSLAGDVDPETVHEVTIEVHPDQPDRQPVAFRLKNPEEELKAPKYQGTNVRASQILVLGDIVP
ncbi:acyl-CoA thioesterase [Blastopirellula marina]|uniref:Acyl-CoA thioesterase n=1 Tax=Blastopirellula marina TaxID=124 RepID=A0A2S8G2Y4_9BACT|nr:MULTISPECIES: SGNH/GDSL hydrolase family protein [Pirellulaceae]PQO38806.1 acyl-CoA thioesterase [Blastopirellula marina]RCS55114.1 SGNH/GDSL hydrolase family protein [Bremerella cremea]